MARRLWLRRLAVEIPAGQFKNRCLKLMDEVQKTRQEVVITKRGRPIAKLVPVEPAPSGFVGSMKGTVEILGDIVAPTGERWEADEG
jgi:prevent-host-death family protein